MQSASSKIWTRVAVSISYDDNHYTTVAIKQIFGTYKYDISIDLWDTTQYYIVPPTIHIL